MCATPLGNWKKKDWKFGSFSNTCNACGREPEPGDTFYSVLADQNEHQPSSESASRQTHSENGEREEGESDEEPQAKNELQEPEEEGVQLFARLDFCIECWDGPDDRMYSFWKNEIPEPEEDEDLTPDRSTLGSIWKGMRKQNDKQQTSDSEPSGEMGEKVQYLVTLMLMRKGYLALEEQVQKGERTFFRVRVRGTEDDVHEIPEPDIHEEEIENIKQELEAVLQVETEEEQS